MMRKYPVRFGGGMMEKGQNSYLASFPPNFLALDKEFREKELEQGLMNHLQTFLVELGDGFAFMGRQVKVEVDNEDYFIDLLFYHVKLRCYFIVELLCVATHNNSYVA